jgi:DNA polymerase-1
MRNRVLIFDGNYCAHRAKHTVGHLVNGTTFGMLRITKAVIDDLDPSHVVFVFDRGRPLRRLLMYPQYKANRPHGKLDGVSPQIELAKEILRSLGVNVVQMKDMEADDIIGILSNYFKEVYEEVIIVTSDHDLYQLIDGRKVVCYHPTQKKITDEQTFKQEYGGLHPRKIVDIKCITGDTSDNIPGIKGIGEKGAIKALNIAHGSITNFPCDDLENDKKLRKINENLDIIQRNLKLVLIPREIKDFETNRQTEMTEIITTLERRRPDPVEFRRLVEENNFKSLGVEKFLDSFDFGRVISEDLDGWLV